MPSADSQSAIMDTERPPRIVYALDTIALA
jgi:hypothetical protein